MITLARHPAVQRIINDWQRSLHAQLPENRSVRCNEEDLRQLIALLEESLAGTADQLASPDSVKTLLWMNWKWITQRFHTVTSCHRWL